MQNNVDQKLQELFYKNGNFLERCSIIGANFTIMQRISPESLTSKVNHQKRSNCLPIIL